MIQENKLKCSQIIEHYGEEHQLKKLVEELAELTQAVMKYLESNSEERQIHLAEEMADVRILMEQLKWVAGKELIDDFIHKKITRQLERMKREQSD